MFCNTDLYPTNLISIRYVPDGMLFIWKLPFALATVPLRRSAIDMEAPANGCPLAAAVILPEKENLSWPFWAGTRVINNELQNNKNAYLNFMSKIELIMPEFFDS